MITVCPNCDAEREIVRDTENEEYTVRGLKVSIAVEVEICSESKHVMYDAARDASLIEKAYAKYRHERDLLSPEEIKKTRARYGLSQSAFAALLGMSEATINRYEAGALQDEAHDIMIRFCSRSENMQELVKR